MSIKKILIIFVSFFLILSGCFTDGSTNSLTQIDLQLQKINDHVVSISGDSHTYQNENLDLSLLSNVKDSLIALSQKLIIEHQSQAITDDQYNDGLNKIVSLLHYIWMEEFDAALKYQNKVIILKIQQEQKEFCSQADVKEWLVNNQKYNHTQALQKKISEVVQAIDYQNQIKQNQEQLTILKQQLSDLSDKNDVSGYNDLVPEYNNLVDANQQINDQYQQLISQNNPENLYQSFLNLVDVKVIFPGQEQLFLVNDNDQGAI